MAASKTAPTAQDFDDADNLFGGDENMTASDNGSFDEADDLLNTVQEDDSQGWVPDPGDSLTGVVVKVDQTRSDFARDGEDPMVPTVTVLTREGEKYRVIAFASVLKREIVDADPHVGDLFAVKYFGEKILKKGKFAGRPYKHYSVAVRRKS